MPLLFCIDDNKQANNIKNNGSIANTLDDTANIRAHGDE